MMWRKHPARILALAGILLASCVTAREVREIVAHTNALMVAPYGLDAEPSSGDGWKLAVQRIDTLIADNPDQAVLVASLRARQAMLLTVYKQDVLAREVWKRVDRRQLKTDRDVAFFLLSEDLIWWFGFADSSGTIDNAKWRERLSPEDIGTSKAGTGSVRELKPPDVIKQPTVVSFEMVCDSLPVGSDTRLFLEVMRANIVLRVINDAAVGEEGDRVFLGAHAVRSIERLVLAFDQEGQAWLEENHSGDALPDGVDLLSVLRPLSHARSLIRKTRGAAAEQNLTIPISGWQPEWVNLVPRPNGEDGS